MGLAVKIESLAKVVADLEDERDKLQKFKDYVHQRLDAMGVPEDPESPHKVEGCRIGGRLDWLAAKVNERLAEKPTHAPKTPMPSNLEEFEALLQDAHRRYPSLQAFFAAHQFKEVGGG